MVPFFRFVGVFLWRGGENQPNRLKMWKAAAPVLHVNVSGMGVNGPIQKLKTESLGPDVCLW